MKSINRFDVLALAILLAALFTVGNHLALLDTDKETERTVKIKIAVSEEGFSPGREAFIDGSLTTTVTNTEVGCITLVGNGKLCDAGILLGNTKYLALNQPIKVKCGEILAEGRIIYLIIE